MKQDLQGFVNVQLNTKCAVLIPFKSPEERWWQWHQL